MLPNASDLDDPDGFVHHEQLDFSELDKMLGEAAHKPDTKPGLKKDDDGSADGDDGKGDDKGDGAE
jgi:hypothetical protein